ncbi:hypothetical protein K227x_46600 [Rubripirellula lacrimiformis]|uniref:Uncharacterized protein n=1 Tax=Rubripirellula lacrimiformis TaxID=1930273 RepID=A0A517NGK0_9BACT|nr:hypothetical protein K227x_46600 [Rubripirellula lacrimiformis]
MSRLACLLILALALQLNDNVVEAGVISSQSSVPSIDTVASASCDLPSQRLPDPKKPESSFRFGSSSGMSGNPSVSHLNPRVVALPVDFTGVDCRAQLCWRLTIVNSVLPGPPLLDGLQKPS